MLNSMKKYKRDIIIGIVASIVASLVIGIGNWCISAVPQIGSSIIETAVNIKYALAANQTKNSLSIALLSCVMGCFAGTIFTLFRSAVYTLIETLKLKKALNAVADEVKDKLNKSSTTQEISKKDKKEKESVDELIQRSKHTSLKSILVCIILMISMVFIAETIIAPADIRDKFDKDIDMIYPYVEEKDIFQLKSDWVLMKSKDDYIAIYEYVDRIKEENALTNR